MLFKHSSTKQIGQMNLVGIKNQNLISNNKKKTFTFKKKLSVFKSKRHVNMSADHI